MAETPALFAERPIIFRHQKAAMYHPRVEALALTLVDVPFTLATMILFTIIVYFMWVFKYPLLKFLCANFTFGFFLTFVPNFLL